MPRFINQNLERVEKCYVAAMVERYEMLQRVHHTRQLQGKIQKTLSKISRDEHWFPCLGRYRRCFFLVVLVVLYLQGLVDLMQLWLLADTFFHSGCCKVSKSQFFPATLVKAVALPRGCVGSARARKVEEGVEPVVGRGRKRKQGLHVAKTVRRPGVQVAGSEGDWFKARHHINITIIVITLHRIPPPVRVPRLVVYRLVHCPPLLLPHEWPKELIRCDYWYDKALVEPLFRRSANSLTNHAVAPPG